MTTSTEPSQRAAPISTKHLANRTWQVVTTYAEDTVIPRDVLLAETGATLSQFSRLKGYIRDHITLDEGMAFLTYQGGYVRTQDPAKICYSVTHQLQRITTELTRILSGAIEPLGENLTQYETLVMYQDEIQHMMRTAERADRARRAMPDPVRLHHPRRRAKRARSTPPASR
ncbi:MAG TPA: hypothetical protein VM677_01245 [Actinokineospora sp.]|nr:hypothetical protein [Actinokineospora sp.]